MAAAMALAVLTTAGSLALSLVATLPPAIAFADGYDCDPEDQQCNHLANCECDAFYEGCLEHTAKSMANAYTFGCRGLSRDACIQIVKQKGLCQGSLQTCTQSCSK
jgi:hypothetical protein